MENQPLWKQKKSNAVLELKKTPEEALEIIAKIVLWAGIIGSIVLFFIAVGGEEFMSLLLILILLPTSLAVWASLRVFANISNSLKEINKKMKSE